MIKIKQTKFFIEYFYKTSKNKLILSKTKIQHEQNGLRPNSPVSFVFSV